MRILFPILRIELDSGKTAAVPTPRGAGVRVVEGRVWATTSGELADTWLAAGDEHQVSRRGLTVLEAAGARATVELMSPADHSRSMQRAIFGIAAAILTAFTIAVAVILPAQLDAGRPAAQHLVSAKVSR